MNLSFAQLIILVIFCFILFGDFTKVKSNILKVKDELLKLKKNQEK